MALHRFARLAIYAVAAGVLLYFFPLVRIRELGPVVNPASDLRSPADAKADRMSDSSPSDIDRFIETLWTERLPKAAGNAATVDDVLAMAATDASGARRTFGREVGLGGPTFLLLRGRGQVETVQEDECRLVIDGQTQRVALEIGILVSNAIRDATGLVNVDDFPNSQDFNRLSAELNKRCESEVIGPIRDQLVVGTTWSLLVAAKFATTKGSIHSNWFPFSLRPSQLRSRRSERGHAIRHTGAVRPWHRQEIPRRAGAGSRGL